MIQTISLYILLLAESEDLAASKPGVESIERGTIL